MDCKKTSAFLDAVAARIGEAAVDRDEHARARVGRHTLPGPDIPPPAILYPGSTSDVQAIVQLANVHRVPLFPISLGWNIGIGSSAAIEPGQVIVSLGTRMNRVLEINEDLTYAVVEPGVSFNSMFDELDRRNSTLMMSPTAGPPDGSILGNAIDKGGGAGPLASHFDNVCGMEVVLGNGDIIRTGDGCLGVGETPNWHVTKYSFGPALDGIFTQSNYGIVTRAGIWMMQRPAAIRLFFFTFPHDDDLGEIIDLIRPLKAAGGVPTQIRATNDVYLMSSQERHPRYGASGRREALTDGERDTLRRKHGIGAWTVSGALYGPSQAALEPALDKVRRHFLASGKATYVPHEDAESRGIFQAAINSNSGRPAGGELGMLKWRPGEGAIWMTPGARMDAALVGDLQRESRGAAAAFGFEYVASFVCGARFARGIHAILYDRSDADEAARADQCYRALCELFLRRGVFVGRAPTLYQDYHQKQRSPQIVDACNAIKRALDPNGIIAPGRYGII